MTSSLLLFAVMLGSAATAAILIALRNAGWIR